MPIVTAKTGEDDKRRARFSAFIVKKETPEFAPERKENKLGLRGSTTGELVLNNVEVSEDAIVGELGKGTAVAMKEMSDRSPELHRAQIT